jgi:hypothetical protein
LTRLYRRDSGESARTGAVSLVAIMLRVVIILSRSGAGRREMTVGGAKSVELRAVDGTSSASAVRSFRYQHGLQNLIRDFFDRRG